jgi:lysophospholipase L1-like esterase
VRTILGDGYHVIEDALNARTLMWDDPYFENRHGLTGLKTALDAHAPLDLVVLQLGCNELKHMFHLTAGMIACGMEKLVAACQTSYYGYPVPKVLLIAPHPTHPKIGDLLYGFNFGPEAYGKSVQLGGEYRAIAEKYGCGFLDCAELGFELNEIDGLHYSKADHAKLADAAAVKIKEMIG